MLSVAPIQLLNNTNYFDPDKTRINLKVSNPNSNSFRLSKQDGYKQRLYFQYLDTVSKGGKVYFYTLTYNNKALPRYMGIPCFDYKDLTYFLNGGFKKYLLRHFNINFKYFVGAELGCGAGSRGYENNPHYHLLLFLYPVDSDVDFCLTSLQLRHLVRKYWQGFDQDEHYCSFENARFGIAKEGDNLGLVTDFRACLYCAKYVIKDVGLKRNEVRIKKHLFDFYWEQVYYSDKTKLDFFNSELLTRFYTYPDDIPDLVDSYKIYNNVVNTIAPRVFDRFGVIHENTFLSVFFDILKEGSLFDCYDNFCLAIVNDMVRLELNNYRNRYCNKCRVSQGLGLMALQGIDLDNPLVEMPYDDGFECKPLCLYLYRKLFYDVVKDFEGNNIYILNSKGIEHKCKVIPSSVSSLCNRIKAIYESITEDKYEIVISSEISTVNISYEQFRSFFNSLPSDYDPFYVYSVFKLVFDGRYYNKCNVVPFDFDNWLSYYRSFITPVYDFFNYEKNSVKNFLTSQSKNYESFIFHPFFSAYCEFFSVLDTLSDYLSISSDIFYKQEYEKIKKVRSFHKGLSFRSYYTNI